MLGASLRPAGPLRAPSARLGRGRLAGPLPRSGALRVRGGRRAGRRRARARTRARRTQQLRRLARAAAPLPPPKHAPNACDAPGPRAQCRAAADERVPVRFAVRQEVRRRRQRRARAHRALVCARARARSPWVWPRHAGAHRRPPASVAGAGQRRQPPGPRRSSAAPPASLPQPPPPPAPDQVKYGESLRVVGNHPSLGAWDAGRGLQLRWNEGHVWAAEVEMEAGSKVEFKVRRAPRALRPRSCPSRPCVRAAAAAAVAHRLRWSCSARPR